MDLKKITHCKQSESGQATVELALVIPIFLVIIFAFIKISYMLMAQQTITYAAREGARAGALTNSNEEIRSAVWKAVSSIDEINDAGEATFTTVEIDPPSDADPQRNRGGKLSVKVVYPFHLDIPYIEIGEIYLTSESITRIEHE